MKIATVSPRALKSIKYATKLICFKFSISKYRLFSVKDLSSDGYRATYILTETYGSLNRCLCFVSFTFFTYELFGIVGFIYSSQPEGEYNLSVIGLVSLLLWFVHG